MTLSSILNESLTESKSKKLLGDLQVAWNKYKFNLDTKPSEAVKWQEKANKIWKQVQKVDPEARNSVGKLWKDVMDADINAGGRTAKIVKMTEGKVKWKKLGDQYTIEDGEGNVIGMFMKQARAHNDKRASYEVEAINGIAFKKFTKISDAKKYVLAHLEG